jgi:hypothetical protein
MPTLKKLKEDRLSITSKLLKTNKDYIPVSPELIKDLRDRTLFSTPSMRLSFAQYDAMCNDDKVLNMMSITLNKPKAKLKKFCKYLSVFKQNIHLNPEKLTAKITETDIQNKPIFKLPKEIRSTILEKFVEILPTKYVLLDWIHTGNLYWNQLSANPNAIELLEDRIKYENTLTQEQYNNLNNKINWEELSENPNAIDLIKERIKYENSLTKEQYNNLEFHETINWWLLSRNPNAIELLKKNLNKIDWESLSVNPNAIDLLEKNKEKINWYELATNPNAIELLKKNQDKIDWTLLSANPNAIDLLKENKAKINWWWLCKNPNAIDLIKERIEYEKTLTNKEYKNLDLEDKIQFIVLNSNPNAIDLLKKNQDKINWEGLSLNPNAIDLLKERIKYEKTLTDSQFSRLENYQKINWEDLSQNPNAISLLKENQDKINWKYLSANPAIFKPV